MPTPLSKIITTETTVDDLTRLSDTDFDIDAASLNTIETLRRNHANVGDRQPVHIAIVSSYMLNRLSAHKECAPLNGLLDTYRKDLLKFPAEEKQRREIARQMLNDERFDQWMTIYFGYDKGLGECLDEVASDWYEEFLPGYPKRKNNRKYCDEKEIYKIDHKAEWDRGLHMELLTEHYFGNARCALLSQILIHQIRRHTT
jgi:hypothetical protein